ncbi:unnamed protein product [Triticum turgidum subsp. durum]|uniref:Peroxidase n=1 Tax=Triticum turgidum subsp. durum TaxID=4567 RepID=A0A9R1A9P4_TRITD|nr:unnamed protein product [Triticum turgidum subsp. durum]
MRLAVVLLCALVAVQVALLAAPAEAGELVVGYYDKKCRGVENVVQWHVRRALKTNRRAGAALVRLLFHDCFVRGCDASVLLDASPENPHPEKEAPVNIGLAAFDLLEEIKAAVEDRCPGVVSCSDILIYAARDAASALSNGNIHFDVPAGRLDGLVSSASEAQAELPDSTFTVQQLIDNFARKDFDVEELVILSGAHSIGVGHCSSFTGRLTAPPEQINPAYRNLLNHKCHQGANPAVVNNTFYHNNLARIVSFNSDWQLMTHTEARGHVHEYADNATLWDGDFADSLLKLSKLSMPAGSKGGIRKKCSIATHPLY